jgi:hypothetical protein
VTDQQAQDLSRGEHARRILGDEMVQEAFATVKQAIRDQMFDLPIEAAKQREFLAMMDKARVQFEGWFAEALAGEQIARLELDAERQAQGQVDKIKERMRAWLA